jgi:transcription elongation factor GreA-like protein
MQEENQGRSESQLEVWFFESLDAKDIPVDHMLVLLAQLAASGKKGLADSWVDLLQDQLRERGDCGGMFRLLKTVSGWRGGDVSFRGSCKDALSSVFKDRMGISFIAAAGFDQSMPVSECLRRFELLNELKPGRFCYDKTWGVGVVQRLEDF